MEEPLFVNCSECGEPLLEEDACYCDECCNPFCEKCITHIDHQGYEESLCKKCRYAERHGE